MLLVPPAAAQAAYPGTNGKIAFVPRRSHLDHERGRNRRCPAHQRHGRRVGPRVVSRRDPDRVRAELLPRSARLATINADGTGEAPFPVFIPGENGEVYAPTWSPDGRRLAYILSYEDNENCFCRVWEMRSRLRESLLAVRRSTAPSGRRTATTIALSEEDDEGVERIYKVSVTPGTAPAPIGDGALRDFGPAWSPDAAKVAYISERGDVASCSGPHPVCRHEVQVANADNTGITRLTDNGAAEYDVEWAPDGSKLVYSGARTRLHGLQRSGPARHEPRRNRPACGSPTPPPASSSPTGSRSSRGRVRATRGRRARRPLRVSLVPTYASCDVAEQAAWTSARLRVVQSARPPVVESHGRHARRQRRGSEHDRAGSS